VEELIHSDQASRQVDISLFVALFLLPTSVFADLTAQTGRKLRFLCGILPESGKKTAVVRKKNFEGWCPKTKIVLLESQGIGLRIGAHSVLGHQLDGMFFLKNIVRSE